MKAFRMRDADGDLLSINGLDNEVAELWDFKPQDKTEYAKPYSRDQFPKGKEGLWQYRAQTNWFDSIGPLLMDGHTFKSILSEWAKPSYNVNYKLKELIRLWIKKGLQPEVVEDY